MDSDMLKANNASLTIPSCLDALPSELLLEIFSHLAPRPSTKNPATSDETEKDDDYVLYISLRNVKAVCRTFAAIVAPLIQAHYTDGDFYHVRLNGSDQVQWDKVKTVILDKQLLNESLSHYRSVPFHKYLSLRDIDDRLGLSEVWEECFDIEGFKQALEDDYGVEDTNLTNFERAAVLCLAPNVEEVAYGSYHDDKWRKYSEDEDFCAIEPIARAGRGEAFGKVHKFEYLWYLSIDVQHMPIGRVIPVMRLPSLQHFVLEWRDWATAGYNGEEVNKALESWDCPDFTSNVQTLELRHSQMPSSIVKRLIKSCKALKSFSLDSDSSVGERAFYLNIFAGLESQCSMLEELVMKERKTREFGDGEPVVGTGGLRKFKTLRHLQIPFRVITGYGGETNDARSPALPNLCELLPLSLRSLTFDMWGATPYEDTTAGFAKLVREADTALPELERLDVIDHMLRVKVYGMPEQQRTLAMDFFSVSALSRAEPKIHFEYTLLHHEISDTEEMDRAREKILRLPHGNELIKHATCGMERKWNALLSRAADAASPFTFKVLHEDARRRGWLREKLSAEELAEKIKPYEPKSIYTSIKYNF
ncbi:hypothetical protein N0V90_001475 [Kalmusia sp. IMI 367209]|nr:hypothetical protein N0V90_001475 [Kalmusia sp. IMI 367209]